MHPPITLLDGPLGTELAARGVSTPLPGWSAHALESAPDIVRAIHSDYAEAGAVLHTANTFRTRARVFPDRWRELTRRAVELCRAGAGPLARVAGSLAPLEDCYRPDLSPSDPRPEQREMALALADAGCDLILCETFPHPGEALVAVEEALGSGLEVWLSLTAGPKADLMNPRTMGETARKAVRLGVSAVLVNCVPVPEIERFLGELAHSGVPFGAYANAGEIDEDFGWRPSETAPARYAASALAWAAAGATLIGSCCGTSPAHTRALAEVFSH